MYLVEFLLSLFLSFLSSWPNLVKFLLGWWCCQAPPPLGDLRGLGNVSAKKSTAKQNKFNASVTLDQVRYKIRSAGSISSSETKGKLLGRREVEKKKTIAHRKLKNNFSPPPITTAQDASIWSDRLLIFVNHAFWLTLGKCALYNS